VSVSSCATDGTRSEERIATERAPIRGGEYDAGHEGVVALLAHLDEQSVGQCTGTLIAPNLVLTARHCISRHDDGPVVCGQSPLEDLASGDAIAVTSDATVDRDSRWFRGTKVHVPPEGVDNCGYDIAIVELAGAGVPSTVAIPHVPRIDSLVTTGERYTAVGYGLTQENADDYGTRQLRDGLTVQCEPGSCDSAFVRAREFVGETGVCNGDSGGPALDDAGRVVGVVSRGSTDCDAPVYVAVSHWRDFIMSVALEASERAGLAPPFWALTGESELPSDPKPPPGGAGGASGAASVAGAAGAGGQPAAGAPCGPGAGCPNGYACYYEDSPEAAVCTPTCQTRCADGFQCDRELDVCTKNDASGSDESSCSVGSLPASGRSAPAGWALVLAAVAVATRRARWW
jgi:hypothetical protein